MLAAGVSLGAPKPTDEFALYESGEGECQAHCGLGAPHPLPLPISERTRRPERCPTTLHRVQQIHAPRTLR